MLTIVTGQPGAGKTLWTIGAVRELAEKSGRPVYVNGIDGLSPDLGWRELPEVSGWPECPDGSIIVVDEAWRWFPSVAAGAQRPDFVQAFATHRHRGMDIFLLMQHATQLDTFPRKMAGRHVHVKRMFGLERATLYEWPEVVDPRDYHAVKQARKKVWKYPRDDYQLYKSAEIHTVESRVPYGKIGIIVGGVLGIVALVALGIGAIAPDSSEADAETDAAQVVGEGTPSQAGFVPGVLRVGAKDVDMPPTGRAGLYDRDVWQPEVRGLEYTALFYDGLIQPVVFPKPTGFAELAVYRDGKLVSSECVAFSQQSTRLEMSTPQCRYYKENGWFDFTEGETGSRAEREAAEPAENPPVAASLVAETP